MPWLTSWLFQFIGVVALLLVPEFPARLTRSGRWAALASLGRRRWERCTQILAPRKCSGETVSDSGLFF